MSERWKPGIEEQYYFFDMFFEVCKMTNKDEDYNASHFAVGNCFKTKDEAEAATEKVKALLLSLPDNGNNLVSNLPDKKQPKLTAEVFNRPDCPEWAKWAAVDYSGVAFFYENKPIFTGTCYQSIIGATKIIDSSIKWDITNSQNSLIERPVKLPEWCKVGEWVWTTTYNAYFKVDEFNGLFIDGEDLDGSDYSVTLENARPARLRPYNAEEMKALVGEKVMNNEGNIYLCTAFIKENHTCNAAVDIDSWVTAGGLLEYGYVIDGKPTGVLEHLENGEWVE